MIDDDYAAGFEEGFRAVAGSAAHLPHLPHQPHTKHGQTPFRMGIRKGIEKGCERKDLTAPEW